jgi:endonuclease YncB( thermonuclease family)
MKMRRVLLLFLPVVSTIALALTPITLQIGDIAVNYYEEHLDLFDETAEYDESLLLSVIDGDVFTVVRHETLNLIEVIRLTGIDAPDSKHSEEAIAQFGLESSRFAKLLLEDRRVFLSYDTMTRDSYGRYFAYVWIPASYEGETHYVLFNLLSLANGYARVYSRHPFNDQYMEAFAEVERLAGLDRTGLWSDESFAVTPPEPIYNPVVFITRTGQKYHQTHCQHLLQSKIPVTLSEAVQMGYEPCSVCKPAVVYVGY